MAQAEDQEKPFCNEGTAIYGGPTGCLQGAVGVINTEGSLELPFLRNMSYSFNVAEVENLFLDSAFLEILAKQILIDEANVELIKTDVINELDNLKEIQSSNYVSAKVNYYFTDSDVSKGNALNQLKSNYQEFIDKISIDDWYTCLLYTSPS